MQGPQGGNTRPLQTELGHEQRINGCCCRPFLQPPQCRACVARSNQYSAQPEVTRVHSSSSNTQDTERHVTHTLQKQSGQVVEAV